MMAHGSRMIDWEDLAQRQIVEIQRALTESIRARATEVPVFFSRARNGKGGTCLGVFEGYSLMEGPPAQPDEMLRITLFIDNLTQAANQRRTVFLREVRTTISTNWDITSGGTKERLRMSAWPEACQM
jgi:hypothetical protein